jgi:hypothetical protein
MKMSVTSGTGPAFYTNGLSFSLSAKAGEAIRIKIETKFLTAISPKIISPNQYRLSNILIPITPCFSKKSHASGP